MFFLFFAQELEANIEIFNVGYSIGRFSIAEWKGTSRKGR